MGACSRKRIYADRHLARHEQCGVAACEWAPQKQTRSCRFFSDFDPYFVKRQLVAAPHLVYVAFPLDSSSKGNPAPPCTLFKLPFFLQPRVVKYKRIYKQRFLKQTCSTNSEFANRITPTNSDFYYPLQPHKCKK